MRASKPTSSERLIGSITARNTLGDGKKANCHCLSISLTSFSWVRGINRKVYDTAIIVFLEFFMTLISNAGSSIAPTAMHDFGIDRVSTLAALTTVYLLGQAIGGLILPPFAESFGGRSIYITSTVGFAFFCVVIAAWPVLPAVIIGRFGSGALSAMPAVVAAGSIEVRTMSCLTSLAFVSLKRY